MPGGQKKAIVRLRNGDRHWGYLPSSGIVEAGSVQLLDVDGKASSFRLNEIHAIAYVRDFNSSDSRNPERLGRTTFTGRPRMPGLWLKLTFLDPVDPFEGIADVHLAALEALAQDDGLTLTPPDLRGNTQRIFFPHAALASVEVLGWIAPPKKPSALKPTAASLTGDLFAPEA